MKGRSWQPIFVRLLLLFMACLTIAIGGTIFFLHPSPAYAAGTTYYIDNSSGSNCSDSGNGQSQPWCNVSTAHSHTFQAGDQILLKAGDVWTNEQLAPQGSGSSSSPIVIDLYGAGNKPRIDGQGNDQGVVALNNQSYWQINNLELTDQSSTYAYGRAGVYVSAPSGGAIAGITIQNMLIHNVTGYKATADDGQADATGGIIINGYSAAPNGITISNNTVHDVGLSGIWVYGAQSTGTRATNVTVSNNVVYNVGGQGIWFHTVSGAQVTHNVVHDSGQYNVGGTVAMWDFSSDHDVFAYNEVYNTVGNNDGEAFDCDGGVQNSIYEYNYSHDNSTGFITWYNTNGANSGCIVRYNISQNDGRSIFNNVGIANAAQVYNNTIYLGPSSTTTIVDGNLASDAVFSNNIFYNLGSGGYHNSTGGTWTHNLFYGNHPSDEPADSSKLTSDPLLAAPGSGSLGFNTLNGYQLKSGSPALGSGTVIANNGGQDLFGNSVSSSAAPNRGAYNGSGVSVSTLTVPNSGFETPNVGSGTFYAFQTNPTGASWTFNNAGISGNGSGFTSGNPNAPEGVQVAWLQGTSSFSQSISGFQANTSYVVSFQAAQRGLYNHGGQDFQVQLDGSSLGTFKPAGASYQVLTTIGFTTTAGSHTLQFQGLDSATGDNTAMIDAVTISTVANGNPIGNSGFETPNVGSGSYYAFQTNPAGASWTFNNAGISGNGSGFTSGNSNAPEGIQVAWLQKTGSFGEVINGFQTTGSYVLTFAAAQRGNWNQGGQNFEVFLDGALIGSFTPANATYTDLSTSAFSASAGSHVLEFVGLDSAGGDNTAFIDNVRLSAH